MNYEKDQLPAMIDINCDLGEIPELIANGTQESLMPHITSVNIACGGHAGDATTMRITLDQALRHGLIIGAHPGYPDPANFGRIELDLPPEQLASSIYEQISALAAIAEQVGARIAHVKPHGALYNQAVRNRDLARIIAAAVSRFSTQVILIGLAGSPMLDVFRDAGFRVWREAFADRRYQPDGTLRSRKFDDALIRDPEEAAEQAARIAAAGTADTLCIHGDTPGAPRIAASVARTLRGRQ
jgi:5-oxoprolinase (ATP-hydrolysing) subunit A